MASRQNPGGGVINGAGAQEENLFRRTDLYRSLYRYVPWCGSFSVEFEQSGYPLDRNHGGIYSPSVSVFRGTEEEGYPLLSAPYTQSFISVAGMNKPRVEHGMIAFDLVEGVKNKMRTIFNIAALHGHDCLILGALGCGAFGNPPAHIARLFREVITEKYDGVFKVIVFAVIDDHNTRRPHNPEGNYAPFLREMRRFVPLCSANEATKE